MGAFTALSQSLNTLYVMLWLHCCDYDGILFLLLNKFNFEPVDNNHSLTNILAHFSRLCSLYVYVFIYVCVFVCMYMGRLMVNNPSACILMLNYSGYAQVVCACQFGVTFGLDFCVTLFGECCLRILLLRDWLYLMEISGSLGVFWNQLELDGRTNMARCDCWYIVHSPRMQLTCMDVDVYKSIHACFLSVAVASRH